LQKDLLSYIISGEDESNFLDTNLFNQRPTVALETLGCKLNQAETESISRQLAEHGCKIVGSDQKADIYVINTCSVTHVADRKSRHLLRVAHRQNPQARLVALGCYADSGRSTISKIEGIDLIVGNPQKNNLVALLRDKGFLSPAMPKLTAYRIARTRSFIKAQDGCSSFCSYCIVPSLRGRETSRPAGEIISDIKQRDNEGCKEIVLTGTELGRYSYEDLKLDDLLEKILSGTDITRLRISSVQPQELSLKLLELWKNQRLCRHFHLSLQSGSGSVLNRMRRGYSPEEYVAKVELIRRVVPEAAITTDVIVGFPGETDRDFQESLDLCSSIKFARVHVFPFSPRKGTAAATMEQQISNSLKKERSGKMLELASFSRNNYIKQFIGLTLPVLFEQGANGLWCGLTGNYIKVYARSSADLSNRLLVVILRQVFKDGLLGEISEPIN
jgi:threonylcarbamoyladenosine tRNA methylthiotransferase MtaB